MSENYQFVNLGYDRFQAALAVESMRSRGYTVELITRDDGGLAPGFAALHPHQALIRSEDLLEITKILTELL